MGASVTASIQYELSTNQRKAKYLKRFVVFSPQGSQSLFSDTLPPSLLSFFFFCLLHMLTTKGAYYTTY